MICPFGKNNFGKVKIYTLDIIIIIIIIIMAEQT